MKSLCCCIQYERIQRRSNEIKSESSSNFKVSEIHFNLAFAELLSLDRSNENERNMICHKYANLIKNLVDATRRNHQVNPWSLWFTKCIEDNFEAYRISPAVQIFKIKCHNLAVLMNFNMKFCKNILEQYFVQCVVNNFLEKENNIGLWTVGLNRLKPYIGS